MKSITLDQLKPEAQAIVVRFAQELKTRARLISFGLLPGCKIKIKQNRKSQPIVIEARGMKIALSQSEAKWIFVKEEDE